MKALDIAVVLALGVGDFLVRGSHHFRDDGLDAMCDKVVKPDVELGAEPFVQPVAQHLIQLGDDGIVDCVGVVAFLVVAYGGERVLEDAGHILTHLLLKPITLEFADDHIGQILTSDEVIVRHMLRLEHHIIEVDVVIGDEFVVGHDGIPVEFLGDLIGDFVPIDGVTQGVVPVLVVHPRVTGIIDETAVVDARLDSVIEVVGLDEIEVVSPVGKPHHHALGDERVEVLLEQHAVGRDADFVHRQHRVETSDLVLKMLETHLRIRLGSGREHLDEVADEATDCGEHSCIVCWLLVGG